MIEPDPLERKRIERELVKRRVAQLAALRQHATRTDEIERELAELDDAIAGVNHMQMEELRKWSERADAWTATPSPGSRTTSKRREEAQDDALDSTFPASDPPAYTAPGSASR